VARFRPNFRRWLFVMHEFELILTLTCALTAALVLGYIAHRLSLSPIVGYLLAGIVVGPATPGFVANKQLANQMAEIGVILLMFGVGLHFDWKDLLAVRRVAIPGAAAQSLVATLLGCAVGLAFGWTLLSGIVFGLAISVASTVVLLRVLADNNDLHTPAGHIAVGWLVVEDLFTVLVLVLVPVVAAAGEVGLAESFGHKALALLWAVARITVLVLAVFYLGGRAIPWILTQVARTRSRELFTLAVLVLAIGLAVAATQWFGVSPALGAFLAGMVVGQSDFSSRAASEALPMRDAFAVLFFVSIGMLFRPSAFWEAPAVVAATLAIVLLGKPLVALILVLIMRYPLAVALSVAVALAQIGEFSFILASLGRELDVLPENAMSAIVAAAFVSISLNGLFYRSIGWIEARIKASPRMKNWLTQLERLDLVEKGDPAAPHRNHAIVVGYGPVGRTLVRMMQENEIEPTVIELNLDTVQRLRADGIRAVYGDGTHRETLEAAGMEQAHAFVLASVGMQGSDESIRLAREINPRVRVLARAGYLRELPALRKAGADVVFSGEGEVALTMTEFLLRQLGASEDQIDRQRARIREELFGSTLAVELLMPAPSPKPPHTTSATEIVDPSAAKVQNPGQ
jgi:CPA2 family monovalent cation:H+ antiporter-2